MSEYTAQRNQTVARLAMDYGINELEANALAREWEFEANRRGIGTRSEGFWEKGRAWIAQELAKRRAGEGAG